MALFAILDGFTGQGRNARPRSRGVYLSLAVCWGVAALAQVLGGGHHAGLLGWVAMAVTMMVPTLVPTVRYLVAYTLRRRRAVWLFLAGYQAVWVAYGAVLSALPGMRWAQPAALAVAAGWQLTRAKRERLRGCRTGTVLPAHGLAADRAAAWYGLRQGWACVGSCWAMMLVMFTAHTYQAAWMVVIFAVVWAEKVQSRGRELARPTAIGFALCAVGTALAG
jgi:predicted metal-binding membrane protein